MVISKLLKNNLAGQCNPNVDEIYTIEMDFQGLEGDCSTGGYNDISLLNCINVKKLLGFYGNCMLFPFSYPQELAEALGLEFFANLPLWAYDKEAMKEHEIEVAMQQKEEAKARREAKMAFRVAKMRKKMQETEKDNNQ